MAEDKEFDIDPFKKVYGQRKRPLEEGDNYGGERVMAEDGSLRDRGLVDQEVGDREAVEASVVVAGDGDGGDEGGSTMVIVGSGGDVDEGGGEDGKNDDDMEIDGGDEGEEVIAEEGGKGGRKVIAGGEDGGEEEGKIDSVSNDEVVGSAEGGVDDGLVVTRGEIGDDGLVVMVEGRVEVSGSAERIVGNEGGGEERVEGEGSLGMRVETMIVDGGDEKRMATEDGRDEMTIVSGDGEETRLDNGDGAERIVSNEGVGKKILCGADKEDRDGLVGGGGRGKGNEGLDMVVEDSTMNVNDDEGGGEEIVLDGGSGVDRVEGVEAAIASGEGEWGKVVEGTKEEYDDIVTA